MIDIVGTKISMLSPQSFLKVITDFHEGDAKGAGAYAVFRDVHGIVRAVDSPELRNAHDNALIVAPDGLPLVWIARIYGGKETSRVCGPDMLPLVCSHGLNKGWRHVFFGSTPATLQALGERLNELYPGIVIPEMISPPFGELSEAEMEAFLSRIRDAQPHFVWIGLGSPKQDIWMMHYASKIPDAICMGVGGAFEMSGGLVKRAPLWIQKTGLEWAFRLAQEPRRLWRRYMVTLPRFMALILGSALRGRLGRIVPRHGD